MISAVLWDMDGTLVDSEPIWSIATYEMAERLGKPLTPQLREKTIGGSFANTLSVCAANAGITPTQEIHDREYARMVARMRELFAQDLPRTPGVPEVLASLQQAGVVQMITTNTVRDIAEGCFDAIGRHFFDDLICGTDVAHPKPAPDIYLEAARRAQARPADCLVFEDSATGMAAAAAAGCRVIGLPDSDRVKVPEGVVLLEDLHGSRSFEGVTAAKILAWGEQIAPAPPQA